MPRQMVTTSRGLMLLLGCQAEDQHYVVNINHGTKSSGCWPVIVKKVPSISQGRVATRFRCGGIFNGDYHDLLPNLMVKILFGRLTAPV